MKWKNALILSLWPLAMFQALAGWKSAGLEGKAILCVAVHPMDPNIVFVGVRDSGIYSSTNGGAQWFHITGRASVVALAIDRSKLGTMYALMGAELLQSTGWGQYFQTLAKFPNVTLNCLALDETPTRAILVGTTRGVYRSLDRGQTFEIAGLADQDVSSIAINNQGSKAVVYAGTAGGGVFKTANYGLTWSVASSGLADLNVSAILCDAKIRSRLFAATAEAGVFTSNNGAEAWTAVAPDSGLRDVCALVQAVDTSQSLIRLFVATSSGQVSSSSDAGANWQKMSEQLSQTVGLCLGTASVYPAPLYFGTLAGLYKLDGR